jgi:prophage antirepressor-like protein
MTDLINNIDFNLSFDNNTIRIVGTHDDPYFIVADVCKILTIGNPSDVMKNIPDKWKASIQSRGGNSTGLQVFNTVSEAGLYKIIMRSKKKIAEKFQEWVCGEVLPSLRKKGEYKMNESYQLKLAEMNKLLEQKEKILEETKKDLKEKTLRVKYTENKLNETKQILTTKSTELKNLKKNHNSILKQRNYHKFKSGKCFYVWVYPECDKTKYKVGLTEDINNRLKGYRTAVPELKLIYLVYLNENSFLENAVLLRLDKYRVEKNHELIRLSGETIIETSRFILEYFKINYTEEEELHLYNDNIYDVEEEDEEKPNLLFLDEKGEEITFKNCPKCKKLLSVDNFGTNPTRGDGKDIYCKECNKKRYEESKQNQKKEVEMKECSKCKIVLEIEDFYNRVGSSDGKTSECKKCTLEMYHNRVENIEYINVENKTCLKCNTEKSIKDFGKKKDSSDGHMPNCKVCWSKIANGPVKKKVEPPTHKVCNKCNEDKLISNFWKRSSYKDGYLNTCSTCCGLSRKKT